MVLYLSVDGCMELKLIPGIDFVDEEGSRLVSLLVDSELSELVLLLLLLEF